VAEAYPGPSALEIRWRDGDGTSARLRSRSITVSATSAALTELRALLGEGRVRLVRGS
jgi:DNA polymerase-3 subunit alpha